MTWRDNYDNPTFATHIDVKEIITKTDIFTIKYNGTIGDSGANYIGFKFTPNCDLENVNVNITLYVKSDNGKAKAVISFIKSIIDSIVESIIDLELMNHLSLILSTIENIDTP